MEQMKDVFKNELPAEIFIRNGQVPDTPPKKIPREKKADGSAMQHLDYDNTLPVDADGNPIKYGGSAHDYNSAKEKQRAENREKNRK